MKRRATQVVAQGADPAAEHARLAMALGYSGVMPGTAAPPSSTPLGTQPAAYPGLHSATPAAAPPAAHGAMTEADVKRIVAAAVKGNAPPTGGGGDADSRRKLKAEERKRRGRLPEGKRCKSGTCDLNHDEKYPGRPCYSDPRVAISVPHEYANSRPGALERLKERRAAEGKRLGVAPKPVTVLPAGAPPACSLGAGAQSFDGLDDWGGARPATLGSAAGMHPLMGAPPVVTGTPVQFSMEELDALDYQCDECADGNDEPLDSGSPARHAGSVAPAPADAQWQSPSPPPPPPPQRWWVVRSPDGQYLDVRLLTHGEWSDLYHAEFDLECHGEGAAGERSARARHWQL